MSKTFWDRFAGLYDLAERSNAAVVDKMIETVVGLVPARSRVLECAAGTGAISVAASPSAEHILCTDYSLPMLEQAKAKAKRLGLSNIDFAQRDIFHLSDSDAAYDVTIAANVLHLLDDPAAAVKELWRLTRPGGIMILPTFLLGESTWIFRQAISLYKLLGFCPKHSFTRQSYQALIDSCGLGDVRYIRIKGRLSVGIAILDKP